MLCAMCAVLGYVAIDLVSIKISFETLPILLACLMFGPIDGAMVGFFGTLIYQLLKYGLTATTIMWMLPYVVCGFGLGLYAYVNRFKLSRTRTVVSVTVTELIVTVLNTGAIYIDSKLFGYYTPELIYGSLAFRLALCIVKGVIFGYLLYVLIPRLRKSIYDVDGGDRS